MKIEIRKADSSDINKLIRLMQEADNRIIDWAKEKARRYALKNNDKIILVAEDGNNLVGFVGLKKYEDNQAREFIDLTKFVWVAWIAVLPEYRNKNIGFELLKSAEKYIDYFNKKGLILDCRQKVITFYVKNGYNVAGEYLDKEIPRYVMMKELK